MERYERLKKLKPEIFKRLTGVTSDTFKAMLAECELADKRKKSRGGKPNKLSISMQILLMLEYYREYRSMIHMAFDYEVSEATVSRTIKEIESVLLKSGKFSLPSKKALYEDDGIEIEYILIDATECPVERPKKSKDDAIVGKRSNIP
ncbi:MAG: Putative transposase [uncultured Sulfurovum sp.]|uniref:Transposase n=1 Tax=uncultured Sulfurovum sp. TaxID=269237 RepID=A0A6S6SWM5_9BACT|nr:MAG: Putative transposase [uncultured Sulfurovum sp.]